MSDKREDLWYPSMGFPAANEVTFETLETPTSDPVSEVSDLTPVYDKTEAMADLQVSRATLHRWLAELRPLGALTCQEDETGRLRLSREDLRFLAQYKVAKNARMKTGLANSQRERIAQLTAGVTGGRREAVAIRRELRSLADSGNLTSVPRRITALLEHVPALRRARAMQRLVWYYATYHASTDLVQLESSTAPAVATVDRAFRAALRRP